MILYKYVTAERALTCLPEVGDGTLRATQPASLNDPFECAVMSVFVEQSEQEGNRKFAEVLTSISEASPVTEDDVSQARKKYGTLFLRELFTKQVSKRFGIVSFSKDPRHPLMWSHYTTDGSGFVIGYDSEQLKELSGENGCLSYVRYASQLIPIADYPVLSSPPKNLIALLSLKSEHWSYEEEWRLIVELSKTIGTGDKDRHCQPINLLCVPNEAVVEVYYTERTPGEKVKQVQARLADPNNRYKARLIKLIMSEECYGYEDAAP